MGNVADRIRTLRIARGLNQGQLADMIGVGRTAISNYEKGLRVPDLETAERLAEAFGISFGDFVDGLDQTRGGNDSLIPSNVRPISSLHRQRVPLIGSVAAGEPIYDPEELGVYDVATFRERRADLDARIAATREALAALDAPPPPDPVLAVLPQVRTVLGAYDLAATPAERNALLRTVLDHISYSKNQRCHRNNAPTDHLSLTLFPRVPDACDDDFSAQNSGSMV